ncbi:hypothetical protein TNCV_2602031 [Trichonephila clavipes]|nr:hypothetical protein TNCV_2602031 [Trichonephila clavipes]
MHGFASQTISSTLCEGRRNSTESHDLAEKHMLEGTTFMHDINLPPPYFYTWERTLSHSVRGAKKQHSTAISHHTYRYAGQCQGYLDSEGCDREPPKQVT